MKEKKRKNGCNFVIMTFTNLEKYVYSKNDVNLPHPSLLQSRRYFHAEKSPNLRGATIRGSLQIFFLTAKIISFLIRNSSVRKIKIIEPCWVLITVIK